MRHRYLRPSALSLSFSSLFYAENIKKTHQIAIGSLVEIDFGDYEPDPENPITGFGFSWSPRIVTAMVSRCTPWLPI